MFRCNQSHHSTEDYTNRITPTVSNQTVFLVISTDIIKSSNLIRKHPTPVKLHVMFHGHHFLALFCSYCSLTNWGRVTHICVGNLTIVGPDNGLSPGRRQAIIWTNARILVIGPWGTNFSEILIGIQTFSFKKMHLKMSSAKWLPFCLGLNVLNTSLRLTVNVVCQRCDNLSDNNVNMWTIMPVTILYQKHFSLIW